MFSHLLGYIGGLRILFKLNWLYKKVYTLLHVSNNAFLSIEDLIFLKRFFRRLIT